MNIRGRYRATGMAIVVALAAGAATSCTPPSPVGPSPAEQFCSFWNEVQGRGPGADPTVLEQEAALVKDQVVAFAERTTLAGTSCTDPSAGVTLDDAVLARGTEIAEQPDAGSSKKVAAVTGSLLSADEPILDNVQVGAISATVRPGGISVRGNAQVSLSGTTSTMGFTGTVQDLGNWTANLSSTRFVLPGISAAPVAFDGTLKVSAGVPTLDLTAEASSVQVGDVAVTAATIDVHATPSDGVQASVSGNIKVGPTTVHGRIDIEFDRNGALVSITAEIGARLQGTQADGSTIDLTGDLTIVGNADQTSISFTGSGVLGDLAVKAANGSLILAVNTASFIGVIDVEQGAAVVRLDASIVWDGFSAYAFVMAQAKGDFSGTLDDGTTVSAKGALTTTFVGNPPQAVVTLDGDFQIGGLRASGSAIVEVNGQTQTTLQIQSAVLTNTGFSGTLHGQIVLVDGEAQEVHLEAAVDGSVTLGDASLTDATLTVDSMYGGPLDISFAGALKVGSAIDMSADVQASIGPDGSLISLNGPVSGSASLSGWNVTSFQGTVVASVEQVTINGGGGVLGPSLGLGAHLVGTFTSRFDQPDWTLNATANVRVGKMNVSNARLRLGRATGMQAIRAGVYVYIIGIRTYLEASIYMDPAGGCSRAVVTGGTGIARLLGRPILGDALGCPIS